MNKLGVAGEERNLHFCFSRRVSRKVFAGLTTNRPLMLLRPSSMGTSMSLRSLRVIRFHGPVPSRIVARMTARVSLISIGTFTILWPTMVPHIFFPTNGESHPAA